jgi:hypothetical protein
MAKLIIESDHQTVLKKYGYNEVPRDGMSHPAWTNYRNADGSAVDVDISGHWRHYHTIKKYNKVPGSGSDVRSLASHLKAIHG